MAHICQKDALGTVCGFGGQLGLPQHLGLFSFRNIPHNTTESGRFPLQVVHQRGGHLEISDIPIFRDNLVIHDFRGFSGSVYLIEHLIHLSCSFRVRIVTVIHPHKFMVGISGYVAQGIIRKGKIPGQINLKVSFFHTLEDASVFFLALPEPLIRHGSGNI